MVVARMDWWCVATYFRPVRRHGVSHICFACLGEGVLSKMSRMSPEILCFILRNSPLRVVKVLQVMSDEAEIPTPKLPPGISYSPLAVTLQTVLAEHPHLTRERLQQTPDNQFLCFWTETAPFSTCGPIEEVNDTWPESKFFRYEIRDSEGQTVGQTDLCVPDNPEDMTCVLGEGVFDLYSLLGMQRRFMLRRN